MAPGTRALWALGPVVKNYLPVRAVGPYLKVILYVGAKPLHHWHRAQPCAIGVRPYGPYVIRWGFAPPLLLT